MNKTDLAKAIVADVKGYTVSQKCALEMIDALTAEITKAVKKGDSVQLIGFGTFSQGKRAARKGRNPQTGKEIKIPAAKIPKFKAGKAFKDAVAGAKKK